MASAGDYVVDVHGDPENADLQQSDAKQTPQYRVHRRYRPPAAARASQAFDDSRSDKRYFFAFTDRSGADVRIVKPVAADDDDDDQIESDFVPIAAVNADEADGDAEPSWIAKSRQLNERVRLVPADVPAWWSLVQLQDSVPGLTKAARLEKQAAILEAAVVANPDSDALWLALIRCSARAGAGTAPIWARALRARPSALIVERYVRAALSSFAEFSIGSVRARLGDLLGGLDAVAGKLHVLSLWLWVERRAGYDERAVAMAQAALEFHLFCPETLILAPFPARLRAFERFWESEVPRVGEPAAPTWAGWHGADAASTTVDQTTTPSPASLRAWFDHEAAIRHRLPLRGADDDDDLDRVVIFDDIRPALFDGGDAVQFVDELLLALGVADVCLTRSRLVAAGDDAVACRLVDLNDDDAVLALPSLHDDCDADVAVAALDQVLDSGRLGADQAGALRVTRALVQGRYVGAGAARRALKADLKRDRANLELAAVLAPLSPAPDAVFEAVLGAAAPWTPPVYCLAWAAVQHALDVGADPRPWLLLAAGERGGAACGAIGLSRARHALSKTVARLGDDAAWWATPFGSVFGASPGLCVALIAVHLEYVCGDLPDALAYFDAVVRPILPPAPPAQREFVWARMARLVQGHARRRPASCPPRLTRAFFEPALDASPLSPAIWAAFVETAAGAGAVRAMFDAVVARLRHDGLYDAPIRVLLCALVFELSQPTATVSGRVHRLFEQALSENGAGVVLLWRLYLRFELVRGDLVAARKVLYRAVDQCPGSRDLWFDAIRALMAASPSTGPGALKDTDLLELVTLMAEKGVRLHSQPPAL